MRPTCLPASGQSCAVTASFNLRNGPNCTCMNSSIIRMPSPCIRCTCIPTDFMPPNAGIIPYPVINSTATHAHTNAKKRPSDSRHSRQRTGGSSPPTAGRRHTYAKNMPPTQTTAARVCTAIAIAMDISEFPGLRYAGSIHTPSNLTMVVFVRSHVFVGASASSRMARGAGTGAWFARKRAPTGSASRIAAYPCRSERELANGAWCWHPHLVRPQAGSYTNKDLANRLRDRARNPRAALTLLGRLPVRRAAGA